VVDLTKRYLEEIGSAFWFGALDDRELKQLDGFTLKTAEWFKTLDDLDKLLGTIPEYRLSTWVDQARRWGRNQAEKSQLEQNAKMQVTVWGGPDLHDYAWKEWSGLVSSFYKERWVRYLRLMVELGDKPINIGDWDRSIAEWELAWTKQPGLARFDKRRPDPRGQAASRKISPTEADAIRARNCGREARDRLGRNRARSRSRVGG
jgi:alpha-N-acetylglucosaminidase